MRIAILILLLVLVTAAMAVEYSPPGDRTFSITWTDPDEPEGFQMSGVSKVRWTVDGEAQPWIVLPVPQKTWTGSLTVKLHGGENVIGMDAEDGVGNVGHAVDLKVLVDSRPPVASPITVSGPQ